MNITENKLTVGDVVVFHDARNQPHHALVTAVWSNWDNPCINVCYVSSDEDRKDSYGRQIERNTSVSHGSGQSAAGHYWRRLDEAPNVYAPPSAT